MSKKDEANLLAILDAIEKIRGYIKGIKSPQEYYQTAVVFDATLMNFVVIGEMVDRLSPELKATYSKIEWQKIRDFRNLVAHDYLGIDAEEVWQIIHFHLPPLQADLEKIVKEVSKE